MISISNIPLKTHSRDARPVVLIITHYFLIDRRGIGGGLGEHYVGLYGTFVQNFSKIYKIFWYSVRDNALRAFDANGSLSLVGSMPMPLAILRVLFNARKRAEHLPLFSAILAYYYTTKNKPMNFILSLPVFHFLRVARLANVIIDIIDPPVEVHVTYSESPSTWKVFWGTMLDILTLKKGTLMWFCSNSYKRYLTRKYGIRNERTYVIYDGSIPELIEPKPPKKEGPLTLFYSGSLMNVKGIPELIESVNELRERNVEVNLVLTGENIDVEMEEKPWIKSMKVNDWLEWVRFLSNEADVCVIPYPRKVHWDLTFHMKLPDYMAAGKPVVSIYGAETAYILEKYKCGLISNNWREFQEHVITLYNDRELARTLGYNGRKAVEEYFNYTNLAETLHRIIQKNLRPKIDNRASIS